jgi:hypothetical protein
MIVREVDREVRVDLRGRRGTRDHSCETGLLLRDLHRPPLHDHEVSF